MGISAHHGGIDVDNRAGDFTTVWLRVLNTPANPRRTSQARDDAFYISSPTRTLRNKIALLIEFQRGHESNDLLLAHLEAATNSMMRRANYRSIFNEGTQRPGF